jgi:copper(I)-binding protein
MAKLLRMPVWLMLSAGIFLAACGSSVQSTGPVFEDAWVRAIPPGMKMTAGFGILSNPEPAAIEVTSFASPSFGDVSLHQSELLDGISKMREVPVLLIAAGATVVLEPGGYHLMLMMPSGDIQPGQTVVIELGIADGRSFNFEMKVVRR